MSDPAAQPFLDVDDLLAASMPQAQRNWLWYGLVMVLLLFALTARLSGGDERAARFAEALSSVAMFAVIVAVAVFSWLSARAIAREQEQLQAAEELIQLRRWGEAGVILQSLLGQPVRTLQARVQGLVFLAAVLARYHRFADVIAVYEHLIQSGWLDGEALFGLKLGRAMAVLRDDRLFDADRAIAELRRNPAAAESGGLALLEICRDVKTGHAQEAIDIFNNKREVIRRQLGHRLADAMVLAAKAYDLRGDAASARAMYEDATLLSPEAELQRRYPEVAALAGKYAPAAAPGEDA